MSIETLQYILIFILVCHIIDMLKIRSLEKKIKNLEAINILRGWRDET